MAGPQKSGEPLVELYRCNNFVAASMTSVYASHTKITENGDIVIESIGRIKDRHLIASPTLPSLEKRTSKSTNKNLYDLSLQLADESENFSEQFSNSGRRIFKDCRHCATLSRNAKQQINNKATNKLWQKSPASSLKKPLQRCKAPEIVRESRNLPNQRKFNPKPQERHDDLGARPVIKPMKQLNIPEINQETQNETHQAAVQPVMKPTEEPKIPEINQETQDKPHQAEVQPNLKEDPAESFKYDENPKKTFQKILQKVRSKSAIKQKAKKQKAAKKNREEVVNKVSVKEVLKALTMEIIQLIVKFIDDNYLYSLIILLGTLAYLGYILFYDISDYLNTELRYLAKMRDSNRMMRWFYYAMRRLRVPIF